MTREQVYVALKTHAKEVTTMFTLDGDPVKNEIPSIAPDTVVGVFGQKDQAETAAEVHGEYKHATDMEEGESLPDVIIYTSDYES